MWREKILVLSCFLEASLETAAAAQPRFLLKQCVLSSGGPMEHGNWSLADWRGGWMSGWMHTGSNHCLPLFSSPAKPPPYIRSF